MLSHLVNYYIQDKMASFIILTTKYIGNNMKTKLSIIFLIVIRAQLLVGQNWDNTYGYDDKGDIGSGYWIGKKTINYILLNQSSLEIDNDMKEIFDFVKKMFMLLRKCRFC